MNHETENVKPPRNRPWAKWALGAGATTLVAVAFMGFLHTPKGRPLLAKMGGCPIKVASAAELEKAQADAMHAEKGQTPAKARFAMGFELRKTKLDDVEAWAKSRGVSCTEKREGFLICSEVPATALPTTFVSTKAMEVTFLFRLSDKTLTNVSVWHNDLRPDAAGREVSATFRGVSGIEGAATEQKGSPETFDHEGAMATATYKYSDYAAELTALQLGGRVTLRQSYQALD